MVYNSPKKKKTFSLKFQASSSKKLRSTKLYHPNHIIVLKMSMPPFQKMTTSLLEMNVLNSTHSET